ncbi:MAG: cardiolipin synthase [Bacilli bacterium]|nr:cardiolipin synthase [Bacilli bacterium]
MKANIKTVSWLVFIILIAVILRAIFEYAFEFFSLKYSATQFITLLIRFTITGIAVLIWIGIVMRSDSTPSKLPWLIFLSFEPFIGLAIFLTFGRNFRKSLRYKAHPLIKDGAYLTREPKTNFRDESYLSIDSEITDIYKTAYNLTSHHAYINDSKVTVLTDGEMMFPRLIEELEKAQEFILMEYYIIRTDKIGKKVLKILQQKAKEGVEVKLLYDAIGSVLLNRRFMNELRESGVEVVANDKVYFGLFNTRVNYRNHRKITIVDSKVAFTGGMNLGDEYNNKSKKFKYFRDTHLLVEGLAVHSLTSLFFRDWYYAKHDFIDDEKYYQANKIDEKGLVQIIPSGPDFPYPPIRNTYVKLINNAKKSIKIMTPYIALDQEMMTSLITAAYAGVKVDIIVPGTPDKKSIYLVTQSFFEPLLAAGIKVYKYHNTFTHAKVLIMDDKIASCGTYNLDNRSARINFEVTVLLSNSAVLKLVQDFALDLSKSKEVVYNKWKKRGLYDRLIQGLFNLFSPLV